MIVLRSEMVPDAFVRVSEIMDTPPIQNDYALFYSCHPLNFW